MKTKTAQEKVDAQLDRELWWRARRYPFDLSVHRTCRKCGRSYHLPTGNAFVRTTWRVKGDDARVAERCRREGYCTCGECTRYGAIQECRVCRFTFHLGRGGEVDESQNLAALDPVFGHLYDPNSPTYVRPEDVPSPEETRVLVDAARRERPWKSVPGLHADADETQSRRHRGRRPTTKTTRNLEEPTPTHTSSPPAPSAIPTPPAPSPTPPPVEPPSYWHGDDVEPVSDVVPTSTGGGRHRTRRTGLAGSFARALGRRSE